MPEPIEDEIVDLCRLTVIRIHEHGLSRRSIEPLYPRPELDVGFPACPRGAFVGQLRVPPERVKVQCKVEQNRSVAVDDGEIHTAMETVEYEGAEVAAPLVAGHQPGRRGELGNLARNLLRRLIVPGAPRQRP